MTEQEKSVKIAEACGFTRVETVNTEIWGRPPIGAQLRMEIPDYFHSLDAMHAAEETLTPDQCVRYNARLLSTGKACEPNSPGRWLWHVDAAQRAEAFGLTLKLWEAEQ